MKIEEAEERLKRASASRPKCHCPREASHYQGCLEMKWWFSREVAEGALHAQAPDTLKALILAMTALDRVKQLQTHTRTCSGCFLGGCCGKVGQLQINADVTQANALFAWEEL